MTVYEDSIDEILRALKKIDEELFHLQNSEKFRVHKSELNDLLTAIKKYNSGATTLEGVLKYLRDHPLH
jgi:hypothetical protein